MRCPFCAVDSDRVIDSRSSKDGIVIRRRRQCEGCKRRFTTYERVEERLPAVVKRDKRREPFDRQKIIQGVALACRKRPVSQEQIDGLADSIEQQLQERGEREVSAQLIGDLIMKALQNLDEVAYVRFASVYRSFKDAGDFVDEVKELLREDRSQR